MKKFFGINSERNSVEDKEVMKIVNQISREEKKNISNEVKCQFFILNTFKIL